MKVKVFKEDIIEGLKKAANIIPVKTGAAFLRTIWLKAENEGDGKLHILATDSNLEFTGVYPADVVEPGLVGVQGRAFYDLVHKLPNDAMLLKIDPKTQNLLIEQGKKKYKLATNDVNWFQNVAAFPEASPVPWSGEALKTVIDQIFFCISEEDTMEAAACINFKPMTEEQFIDVCGLNGHQFAMVRFQNDALLAMMPPEGLLIQRKYLAELNKWLPLDEIECNIDNKRFFFRSNQGQETFSLPLSYYQFPDYRNFIGRLSDENATTLMVDKAELSEALNRLLIFNSENNRCTFFEYLEEQLVLTAQGQDVGAATEMLDVVKSGPMPRIAFPTRNFIEILNHFFSDKVKMTLTGAEGPCGLTGEKDYEYTVIIMPMKIVEETYYSEEEA
jgi:DNA polymerase-3 subunit beta